MNLAGTLSRISNWDKMTEGERATTIRVLTKRNAARLKALRDVDADLADEVEKENAAQLDDLSSDKGPSMQHSEL